MKKKINHNLFKSLLLILISGALLSCLTANAQNTFPSTGSAGIGTTTPNASSKLEIKSTTRGFLAPRMNQTQRNAIGAPATGLLIYQIDSTPGFYYYSGSAWKTVTPKAGWSLTGNAGTNPSANFLGTTDAQSLVFKVNNTWAGIIDNSTYNTGTRNTAFGLRSLYSNTSGLENTAIGYGTLYSNQSGNDNSALGKYALSAIIKAITILLLGIMLCTLTRLAITILQLATLHFKTILQAVTIRQMVMQHYTRIMADKITLQVVTSLSTPILLALTM